MPRKRLKESRPAAGRADATKTGPEGPVRMMMDVTGLCAMWTGHSAADPERYLKILMLSGMNEDVKHRPVLTFNMRHFVSLSGAKKAVTRMLEVIQLPDGEQMGSWELESKIAAVKHQPAAVPGKVKLLGGHRSGAVSPSDPTEEFGLQWIPSVARATGESDVRIREHYLGNNPRRPSEEGGGTPDDRVLARFDVPQGFVYSSARVNELREPDIWKFMDEHGVTATQFIAETARCEVRHLPADTIQIDAFPFGRPAEVETLILRAWDDAIRMTLTNLPPVDRLRPGDFPHFEAYYGLLSRTPERTPIPVLTDESPAPPPPAGEDGPGSRVGTRGVRPIMCSPCCYP